MLICISKLLLYLFWNFFIPEHFIDPFNGLLYFVFINLCKVRWGVILHLLPGYFLGIAPQLRQLHFDALLAGFDRIPPYKGVAVGNTLDLGSIGVDFP